MDVSSRKPGDSVRQSIPYTNGFSLIEVLITLFILSIGLLSLAAMQIQGLRATHGAMLRTHAVLYATEIAEQLHAAATTSTDSPPACDNDTCIGNETLLEWQTRVREGLPNGSGTVSLDAASVIVSVVWDEHGETQQVSVSVVL
jgi:type IV pilus assembly protein PilV